jgi:type I restriction enzyme S subunit
MNKFPLVPLGEICHIQIGGTPSRKEGQFWDVTKATLNRWASIADLKEKYLHETAEYISESGVQHSNVKPIPANTVLYSFKLSIGRRAITKIPVYTNEAIAALIPKKELDTEYLYYALEVANYEDFLDIAVKGKTLNKEKMQSLLVPLPPLPVQRRIAEILGSVDELIRNVESILTLLVSLEFAILNQFVTHLLRTSKIMDLGSVSEVRSGITKGRTLPNNIPLIDAPYLRVANVQDGFLDLNEIKTIPIFPQEISEYKLEPGDLVLTEGGDLDKLGRGALWDGQIPECVFQNHIFRVRVHDRQQLYPEFLTLLVRSRYGKTYFLNCAKRTTNLASINSTQLKQFPVLLPTTATQRNVIESINGLREVYNNQKRYLVGVKLLKGSLLSTLLTNPANLDSVVSAS